MNMEKPKMCFFQFASRKWWSKSLCFQCIPPINWLIIPFLMELFYRMYTWMVGCVCIPFDGIKSIKLCANNNIYARLNTTSSGSNQSNTVKSWTNFCLPTQWARASGVGVRAYSFIHASFILYWYAIKYATQQMSSLERKITN